MDSAIPIRYTVKLEIKDVKEDSDIYKIVETYSSKAQSELSIGDGSIFKAVLFKTASGKDNQLLIIIHHLAVDGISWRILVADLQKACLQQQKGKNIDLGTKTSSYRQWAERLIQYANSKVLIEELSYWKGLTEGNKGNLPS